MLVVVVAAAAAGAGRIGRSRSANGSKGITVDDMDLRLGKAEIADVQVAVNEVGTIEPEVKVDVKSALSGRVTDLLVREGDRVEQGRVLARVEPDVNQAQTLAAVRSDLNLAEIKARDAQRDVETRERLFKEGYLSETEMKDFRVRLQTSGEALDAARTRYRIVEESGIPLQESISTTQRVNVVSPMTGYVVKRNVEVGQTVTSGVSSFNEGTVIVTVADLRSMLIKAAINEVDIGKVRLGMAVVITVDAFPYRRFAGTLSHVSPAARLKEKIKVFDVEVRLPEQVSDFRAGMTANVEIRGDRVDKTLSVPVEAVFKKSDREVVYVLKKTFDAPKAGERGPRKLKSGKVDVSDAWQRYFEERPVRVGLASLERAQILEGLQAGLEIALEDPTRPRQIEEE